MGGRSPVPYLMPRSQIIGVCIDAEALCGLRPSLREAAQISDSDDIPAENMPLTIKDTINSFIDESTKAASVRCATL